MRQSESIGGLLTALAEAQKELKNPGFDSVNPHFKSKFASLAAIRSEVVPVLAKHGLSVSQWPIAENGSAGCRTVLGHKTGEWIEETFLIPVDKPNAHGYASAVTYAKRISMQSVASVVGDDDDDGNSATGQPAAAEQRITPTGGAFEAQTIDMQNHILGIAHDVSALLKRGDVAGAWLELTSHDADFDEHQKVALWSRLDSKERSALKKESERLKTTRGATPQERAAA